MFKRKACAAMATSIIAPLLCILWLMIFEDETMSGGIGAYLFYALYAVPLVLIYGLPVSCFSDFLGKKIDGAKRLFVALLTHVLFGFGFTFVFTLIVEPDLLKTKFIFSGITFFFIWGATLSSIVYWAVDEYIRFKNEGRWNLNKGVTN